jgi:hypothetical protein
MFSDRACFDPQTCVEVGLPAAGLVGREFHAHAKAAQNVHDRLTRLRVERIDQAGDEQLDCGHISIVSPNQQQFF